MAPSAKNSNGFLGPSIGRFPAPNFCRTRLGGAPDFWLGGRGRVWRQLQISFPAHAENTKSKAATGSKAVWLFTFLDSPVNHYDPANDRNQI